MKNIQRVLFLFCLSLVSAVIIQSCCQPHDYKILGSGTLETSGSETITGAFKIHSNFDMELIGSVQTFGLINSAYATTCPYDVENEIEITDIELSVDKDFLFRGNTIPANTNIIKATDLEVDFDDLDYTVYFNFDDDYLENVDFEEDDHTFKLKAETSDGILLEPTITLKLMIN